MDEAQLSIVSLLTYTAVQLPCLRVLEVTHLFPGLKTLLQRVLHTSNLASSLASWGMGAHTVRPSIVRHRLG
jgi:hypothetical protein